MPQSHTVYWLVGAFLTSWMTAASWHWTTCCLARFQWRVFVKNSLNPCQLVTWDIARNFVLECEIFVWVGPTESSYPVHCRWSLLWWLCISGLGHINPILPRSAYAKCSQFAASGYWQSTQQLNKWSFLVPCGSGAANSNVYASLTTLHQQG